MKKKQKLLWFGLGAISLLLLGASVPSHSISTLTSLTGFSWFLDEDNMSSDDATKVPSQQSVKAYADTKESATSNDFDPDRILGDTTDDDKLEASLVNVAGNPGNYTEDSTDVEGHLSGIDTALGLRANLILGANEAFSVTNSVITVTEASPDTFTLERGSRKTVSIDEDTTMSFGTSWDTTGQLGLLRVTWTADGVLTIPSSYSEGRNASITTISGLSGQVMTFSFEKTATGYTVSGDPTTSYKTFYVDAGAMAPRTTNGAAASIAEEYTTNDIIVDSYLFDGTTGEGVQWKMAMPDDWDLGTIKAKVYWDAATGASAADTVEWEIAAGAVANDGAIDAALGTAIAMNDVVLAVGDVHISPASAAVTVGGTPALGYLTWFQIVRDPAGTDDMTEDAKLLGVAIQYQTKTTPVAAW